MPLDATPPPAYCSTIEQAIAATPKDHLDASYFLTGQRALDFFQAIRVENPGVNVSATSAFLVNTPGDLSIILLFDDRKLACTALYIADDAIRSSLERLVPPKT